MNWSTKDEIKALFALVKAVVALQVPGLGAALLNNHSIDAEYLQEDVLAFVALTASKIPVELLKEADMKSVVDEKGQVAGLNEAERVLLDFEGAAKDWFRRIHANEPPEPPKKEEPVFYSFSGGYQREKPKPPTPQELAEKRLKALRKAIETLDATYKIPFFDHRPRVSHSHFHSTV